MENFDLKKFLVENKLTANSRILNENFYAPDYIKQKYGNKAKEIEQNIHDAEESENNPNLWDHFTSLETSEEVEDFIQGFINENVEVEEVTLGNTRFAVEEPDPLDDGIIISISKHKNGYFITGEVQDEDGDVKEGYGYGVDFEGNIIEDVYDAEDLDKETDLTVNEGMDFSTGNTILAIVNYLIDNDRQDVLDVLQEIPQWNELVDQATDM